ncbi:MAG TPA: hypothetical protein ENI66_00405 [Candidatus Yonathbacteria bacterium]|nr:hypothetical protein [Candidatus Yonathbacteria bacterium]
MSLYHPKREELLYTQKLLCEHASLLQVSTNNSNENTKDCSTVELLSSLLDKTLNELESYKLGECPEVSGVWKLIVKLSN